MDLADTISFIASLDDVQNSENFGYRFFFVGDDHRLPFATIADSDNEYDSVSNLSREGVFRLNVGVSRETFRSMFGELGTETDNLDYTALDTFMPHPDYAKQNFICILNPTGKNEGRARDVITEAHGVAAERYRRSKNI